MSNWKLLSVTVLLASLCGFVGGVLSQLIQPIPSLEPADGPATILRAHAIEIVDAAGRRHIRLEPGSMQMFTQNGKTGARLYLFDNKPMLVFSDGRREGRLLLGFLPTDTLLPTDDDWGLVIRAPGQDRPVAAMGTRNNGVEGSVWVSDQERHSTSLDPGGLVQH